MPSGSKPVPGALTQTVAGIIDEALKRRGKPQRWLGDRAGISQRQVSRYMLGEKSPTIDQVDDMCNVLGLDFVAVMIQADAARR